MVNEERITHPPDPDQGPVLPTIHSMHSPAGEHLPAPHEEECAARLVCSILEVKPQQWMLPPFALAGWDTRDEWCSNIIQALSTITHYVVTPDEVQNYGHWQYTGYCSLCIIGVILLALESMQQITKVLVMHNPVFWGMFLMVLIVAKKEGISITNIILSMVAELATKGIKMKADVGASE
ncbi:hypothetical protein DACRYDRAFT_108497 [Dacryopinax primogenitus]|uniref:Uncharacterized protein n=1 Tax=Dacryopinax primogenitus (strain DJM 731) TaxID=1858805 RepID=M5G5U5_DACPD|nr:uncharacterized protein DACRYDRAFT_108497 [Dacryopinax primogenitus]EJU01167.1 hypothetical protein DACRYDRAFT_108497 [Dacryopinax primogenitus]